MLSAAEIAAMQSTINSSLDVTITVKRKGAGQDVYGHANGTYTSIGTALVNIIKPSAVALQLFAEQIAAQKAVMIRFALTTDIQENDLIAYSNKDWKVQYVENAESYTFCNDALMTVVS